MNKIFLCSISSLEKKDYFVKFIEEIKDEVIVFRDRETNKLKLFSSICPHFGGEIFYNKKEDVLKCKWHGWKYCKNTGKCLSFSIKGELNPYNFEIDSKNVNIASYDSEIIDKKIYIIV
jgi:nitrite reductase/ring-hydroxylating ferredoxin subunit